MGMTVNLYGGVTPYQWQKETHDYITAYISEERKYQKIITIKAARQVYGKSALAKAELLRFSLQKKDSLNAYVAPTLKLAKKMYDEILKCCSVLIESKNSIDMKITFITGSAIRFFSAEQRDNLRGFNVNGVLIIDEAAFITDDVYYELLSPWTVVAGALTIIISTPKFRQGFFYELLQKGLGDSQLYKSFDWTSDHPPVMNEFLEQQKKLIPAQKFKSEYLGLFLDAEGSVFGDFSQCIIHYKPSFQSLYFGLDFGTGSGKDDTVLTALNENREQVLIWRCNDKPPTEQVEIICGILLQYRQNIKKVVAEQNSIGKVYLDMFRNRLSGQITITPFNTTNESKRKLVEDLQVEIQNNTIKILNDTEQSQQLSFYEATVNSTTNKVSYNAPSGYNDDMVIALMLALEATKRKGFTYSFI